MLGSGTLEKFREREQYMKKNRNISKELSEVLS